MKTATTEPARTGKKGTQARSKFANHASTWTGNPTLEGMEANAGIGPGAKLSNDPGEVPTDRIPN
jgi:hypothetical protein